MKSYLFSPITLGGLTLNNRIIVAPMCQYSANDGLATDWHLMHLGQYAVSGPGLIITEAVGVEMKGRISPGCLSLCSDAQEDSLKRVVNFCNQFGNARMGIQLAHAGRKGSTDLPWLGGKPIPASDTRSWETEAPSALPYAANGWHTREKAKGLARRVIPARAKAREKWAREAREVANRDMARAMQVNSMGIVTIAVPTAIGPLIAHNPRARVALI